MKLANKGATSALGDRVYDLPDYRFIEVSGPDALTFTQAQVTNDLRRLEQKDWLLGAQCNSKGRMILSFLAFQGGNGINLRVHKSLEQAFEGLKKYAVFTKVKFAQFEMPIKALVGKKIVARISSELKLVEPLVVGKFQFWNEAFLVARADDWIEIYGVSEGIDKWIGESIAAGKMTAGENFDEELIRRGIAEVRSESVEEFVPQMFNYEHIDAISFKKGCYTGQEVVARMQYLGKLKKHLYRGKITDVHLPAGAELMSTDYNEPQGVVVISCGDEFLAVVNDHVVANHTLSSPLNPGSKIQWLQLPYAIPM